MAFYLSTQVSFGQVPSNDPNWSSTPFLDDEFNTSEHFGAGHLWDSIIEGEGNTCFYGLNMLSFQTISTYSVLAIKVDTSSFSSCSPPSSYPVQSGGILSTSSYKYGYYTANCEMAFNGVDFNGNFWMYGGVTGTSGWWNEIDCEIINSYQNGDRSGSWPYPINDFTSGVHFDDASYTNMVYGSNNFINSTIENTFHVYSFEWLPNHIIWYFDGNQINELTTEIPDHAISIWISPWTSSGAHTTDEYPGYEYVDYVRAYDLIMDSCSYSKIFKQNADISNFAPGVRSSITFGNGTNNIDLSTLTNPLVFRASSFTIPKNSTYTFKASGKALMLIPTSCYTPLN